MEPGSDTGGALALRWAADLIGLSVTWFVFAPAVAATIGLGWGSLGLGVLAVRLSVALGFASLAGVGALLARAGRSAPARVWFVVSVGIGVLGGLSAFTPFIGAAVYVAVPLAELLLAVGLSTLPVEVGGGRPRFWWRIALVAQVSAIAGLTTLVVVGPARFGFRRARVMDTGFSLGIGQWRWTANSTRGTLVMLTIMTVSVAALVLLLTAVTLTRRWAQGQLDAARPLDRGPAPGGVGAPTTSPRPPAPAMATSVGVEEPRWDPAETDGAWETVRPRPDDDLLRP